jgi:hypothetical protein
MSQHFTHAQPYAFLSLPSSTSTNPLPTPCTLFINDSLESPGFPLVLHFLHSALKRGGGKCLLVNVAKELGHYVSVLSKVVSATLRS